MVSHPFIYSLVDAFRREQRLTEMRIIKLMTGLVHKRKLLYILLDEILQNILKNYNNKDSVSFLKNLSLILKYLS